MSNYWQQSYRSFPSVPYRMDDLLGWASAFIAELDATLFQIETGIVERIQYGEGTYRPDSTGSGNIYYDTDTGYSYVDLSDGWTLLSYGSVIPSSAVSVPVVGTPTYDRLDDFINNTMSSGAVVTPTITDNGDGTIDVAASSGYIRATDSDIAELLAFDVPAATDMNPTDGVTSYLYVDYNSGSPQYALTTSLSTVDHSTTFVVGLVFGASDHVHFVEAGQYLNDFIHRFYFHAFEHDGLERSGGMVTTESGNRKLDITAGTGYWALSRITTDALNTNTGGDDFRYYYQDGGSGWTESSATTAIDNTYYDDGTGTLHALTANRYGVHWVFLTPDSALYVLYGRGDYTLAQAQAATVPATMPAELSGFSFLIAKIIVQQGATNLYSITLPWTSSIGSSVATDHGGMGGLGDDDHLQYLPLSGIRAMTGDLDTGGNDIDMAGANIKAEAGWRVAHETTPGGGIYSTLIGTVDSGSSGYLAVGQVGPSGYYKTVLYSGTDDVEFDAGWSCPPASTATDYTQVDNSTGDLNQYGDSLIRTETTVEADEALISGLWITNQTKSMTNNSSQNFFKWGTGNSAGNAIGFKVFFRIKVEYTALSTTYYWTRSGVLEGHILHNGTYAYSNGKNQTWLGNALCRSAAGSAATPTMNEQASIGAGGSASTIGPYFLVNLSGGTFVSGECTYSVRLVGDVTMDNITSY